MKKIILAVDDETSVLRSLNRVFRSKSYDFISFNSPVEALLALKTIKPHIIISDQRMPLIHGADFLSKAKTISQRSLRIMLTGYNLPDDACDHHIDRIMMKPWINDELEHEIVNTTVHYDKIYVSVLDPTRMKGFHECSLCGLEDISHEIRFDNFTEYLCVDCHAKLISYAGSSMESTLIKQMIGNVY